MISIGIVGGGAAAVSLLRQLPYGDRLDVHVYTDARPGPGRAYAERSDSALLNRQVFAMSVSDSWPDEFHDWVRANAPEHLDDAEHSFVPRSLYGDYLTGSTETAAAHLGDRLTIVSGRVVDMARHDGRYRLTVVGPRGGGVAEGVATEVVHDLVILALGSSPPADPYRLTGVPGYTCDPYPTTAWIDPVCDGGESAVIGTGLSAIDVALAVRRRDRAGRLTMCSRNGILPDARAIVSPLDFDPDISAMILRVTRRRGGLEWQDVLQIVDYLALGEGIRRSEVRAAFRAIAQPAGQRWASGDAALSVDVPVQRLVIGIAQHYVNEIWAAMTRRARATFLATTHAAFQALSNPLPAKSARALGEMVSEGRLTIRAGVTDVEPVSGAGFDITFADGARHPVGHVVNATRTPAGAPSPAASALVSSLLYRGLAQANPYGGLRVDVVSNALLDPTGVAVPGVFVIGEIASGDLYYISSMGKIRRRARTVARQIVDESLASNQTRAPRPTLSPRPIFSPSQTGPSDV